MEAAEIEPAIEFGATGILPCGCVISEQCRAALALQMDDSRCLRLALHDGNLQRIVGVWDRLPETFRSAVAVLVESQI